MSTELKTDVGTPAVQRRWAVVLIGVFGVALIALPLVFGMFTKAPKGAVMMAQFKPFMTTARLDGYQHELQEINAGIRQTDSTVATALDGSNSHAAFASAFPTFASFDQQWPQIDHTMTSLMSEVQANQGNYEAIAALPSFRLFPWFFVLPGVLLLGLALLAVLRPTSWRRGRWVLIVLGIGLVAAPGIFQMFGRAPKGGQMMTAFKHIETTSNVQNIQGYFGTMAEGQGAIRLEIVPGLEHAGYSAATISTEFPAVATLDTQWVHILNDMTPMIGAMSDNVVNYQALVSLPSFPLFPWFFVVPGVAVAGLAIAAGRPTRIRRQPSADIDVATPPSVPFYSGVS
jgi:hypothetical protein